MRRLVTAAVGGAIAVLAIAGCADAQPGDQNNGPGYTNNAADLLVKINALQADPCRSAQAPQLYSGCGRFATEVANSVITLRNTVPSVTSTVNAMSTAATNFHQLGCDAITGKPTAAQSSGCPQALISIGADLDTIEPALARTPTSSNP